MELKPKVTLEDAMFMVMSRLSSMTKEEFLSEWRKFNDGKQRKEQEKAEAGEAQETDGSDCNGEEREVSAEDLNWYARSKCPSCGNDEIVRIRYVMPGSIYTGWAIDHGLGSGFSKIRFCPFCGFELDKRE